MGVLWNQRIRPTIVFASFILFFVLVRPHDRSVKLVDSRRSRYTWRSLHPESHFSGVARSLMAVSNGENEPDIVIAQPALEVEGEEVDATGLNKTSSLESHRTVEHVLCAEVREHAGYPDSCSYIQSIPECRSGTLVDYTAFFFCTCKDAPVLAYIALTVWLVILFYMLGNQAADFFCCSIQKLSTLLHLPPTLAGVTLLPLGNGAPDVFASIAAFVGAGQGQVGLNSVLGGATFVTTVVAGSASLVVASTAVHVHLDRRAFIRDIGFFLFTLSVLTVILYHGEINFWGAVGYISIYGAYAASVAAVELFKKHRHKLVQWQALQPLLQGQADSSLSDDETGYGGFGGPYSELFDTRTSAVETTLPQWAWAPHVAIYSQTSNLQAELDRVDPSGERALWGNHEQQAAQVVKWYSLQGLVSYIIEWPLTLPRRLTTPLVEEDRWSKFYAVSSATLAPTLLAVVWDGKDGGPMGSAWKEYMLAGSIGVILGGLALFTTQKEHPPRRYVLPWALGGFVMSIVWFYIIANELVSSLVSLGVILDIDASILGLTVLAWGNSIGDLMSNLALVCHGGDGVQIAFSGCYAGPMFNTLVGIGLSFVLASWKTYPQTFVIPQDGSIFFTLAFLVAGLVWAFSILPSRGMQPTRGLGIGLLSLYIVFIVLRVAVTLGLAGVLGDFFNISQ